MTRGKVYFLITSAFLIGGFFIFVSRIWAAESDLQITEIMYDPSGSDTKNEWLEIKNSGLSPLEIMGGSNALAWRLFDGSNHTFSTSTILEAGEYCAVVQDESTFTSNYPNYWGKILKSSFSLGNTSGTVALRVGSDGPLWSEVNYSSSWGASGNGKTLEKKDETGVNTADNWQESFVAGGTLGALRSESLVIPPSPPVDSSASSSSSEIYHIKINEVYPVTATSAEKEWVEFFNPATSTVNLMGWTLQDNSSTTTLEGDIVSGGFLVLEFSSRFNNSGDTVILKNSVGEIIDQMSYGNFDDGNLTDNASVPLSGQSLARLSDSGDTDFDQSDFALTLTPTKNQSNVITLPPEQTTSSSPAASSGGSANLPAAFYGKIFINEFVADPNEQEQEWVELYNNSAEEVNLNNWWIEEGSEEQTFLQGTIKPHGFFLVYSPKGNLNNSGDVVFLYDAFGRLVDRVAYGNWNDGNISDNAPAPYDGKSAGRKNFESATNKEGWVVCSAPTPGNFNAFLTENVSTDNSNVNNNLLPISSSLIINEIFPNPKGSDQEGEFIELKNIGTEKINLQNFYLLNSSRRKYKFTSSTFIGSGEFLVVKRKESNLTLKNNAENLELYDLSNHLLDRAMFEENALEGVSWARAGATSSLWDWTVAVTPGRENIMVSPNSLPVVVVSLPSVVLTGEEVIFDASDSFDPDNNPLSFFWDFGDGTNGEGEVINHFYQTKGNKKISLVVKDNQGGEVKQALKIYVETDEEIGDVSVASSKNSVISTSKKIKSLVSASLDKISALAPLTLVKTKGVVVVPPGIFSTQMFFIVDPLSGAGLPIYMNSKDFPPIKIGDEVEVTGELGTYLGTVRVKIKEKKDIDILSIDNLREPLLVNTGDIDDDKFFSLVQLEGEVLETGSGYFYLGDEAGEIQVQLKSRTGLKGKVASVGDKVRVIGIIGKSKDAWVLWPRGVEDLKILDVGKPLDQGATADVTEKYLTATAGGVTSLLLALLAKGRGALAKAVALGFIGKIVFWKKRDKI